MVGLGRSLYERVPCPHMAKASDPNMPKQTWRLEYCTCVTRSSVQGLCLSQVEVLPHAAPSTDFIIVLPFVSTIAGACHSQKVQYCLLLFCKLANIRSHLDPPDRRRKRRPMLTFTRAFAPRRCRAPKCARTVATDASTVRVQLRSLLRDTAQPVAVVTALMDPDIPHKTSSSSRPRFHGATLSSFSSISMDPHPLVAFSLRIPSRMATSLTSAHTTASSPAHLVVNILSERQARAAACFSRADLYPEPFKSVSHTLTEEGLPVLDGCVGAMSCRLVAASWPLHDLQMLAGEEKDSRPVWEGEGVASELFIAEVVRVERTSLPKGEEVRPLLYHRRTYATTSPIELDPGAKPSS